MIFACAGYLALIVRWRGNTNIWESLEIFPGGFATGVTAAVAFISLSAGIKPEEIAVAGTGQYLSAGIGAVLGLSISSAVLNGALRSDLPSSLAGVPNKEKVIKK
jgi:hypothetical protein